MSELVKLGRRIDNVFKFGKTLSKNDEIEWNDAFYNLVDEYFYPLLWDDYNLNKDEEQELMNILNNIISTLEQDTQTKF
jgi:hypothetical protein